MPLGIIFANALDHAFLGHPKTPEEWHKALLLPEDYKMLGVTHNHGWDASGMIFIVESTQIPESETGLTETKPIIGMIHNEANGTNTPMLHRIEFEV